MDNWLVISNCQTYGFANCLQAQVSDALVNGVDVLLFTSDPETYASKVHEADILFISAEIREALIPLGMAEDKPWVDLPMFTFRAYHPDLTYIKHGGDLVSGPTNHYHSAIAFACFKAGLSESDTLRHFNRDFFDSCGYFGIWSAERDRLVSEVLKTGVDISEPIRRWGRESAFMYSINHPKIRVLYDISTELIKLQGKKPVSGVMPHDNLTSGPHFSVYPEIAETLGVTGSYVFKDHESYRPFNLEHFIYGSFDVYRKYDPDGFEPHQHVDHIASIIRG
ncbi:uncharacterized protein PY1_contig-18-16 [Novosphingobium sp. PY1]|nr:uncharacterized protein PY1_contig-18-16 [Novosphingobium sp. PY1]